MRTFQREFGGFWLSKGKDYTLQPSYLNEFIGEHPKGLDVLFQKSEGKISYIGAQRTCTADAVFLVLAFLGVI